MTSDAMKTNQSYHPWKVWVFDGIYNGKEAEVGHGGGVSIYIYIYIYVYMGGCQFWGPFLGPYYNTAPDI